MLIDARHPEETRVAVIKGTRIEEFDFESVEHRQLKGNIYLAKVTRVEPSLQAAFVDYGEDRHGFLPFSEIHPDYYQIPKEDREALLREEAEQAAEEARLQEAADAALDEDETGNAADSGPPADYQDALEEGEERPESAEVIGGDAGDSHGNGDRADAAASRARRFNVRRRYKIQDVIHRRQVLLVQVVKEERGSKGAALTTYLSLAGRYCVLMPNSTNGGGISRKISNVTDRKRLRSIIEDLSLPGTMGLIVRTAGLQRTKIEIRRDFDYLARLWDEIREKTLASSAPARIYTDSDLIRRAIRDIYNKDIDEISIEGEAGFRAAREFMKLLMPSHVKKVKAYGDAVPLFQRYGVEDQLAAMYQPVVPLKSGGYLVINPTEALVSIDINSGRATREHGVEATATNTNIEAAQEIARQLRLRDMAGLVVIDFIDMEHGANIRKVERTIKAALANDRARIQVGRISSFGLLEMSRQRLRTGVLEASTKTCPHCEGTGLVRTASSAGLSALRMIEEEAARGKGSLITLKASQEAACYLLNNKRRELIELEIRYGVRVEVLADGEIEGARMTVGASGPPPAFTPSFDPILTDEEDEDDFAPVYDEVVEDEEQPHEERKRRSRRKRGRRGRSDRDERVNSSTDANADTDATEDFEADEQPTGMGQNDTDGESTPRRRSRRNRRGGKRMREAAERAGDDADTMPIVESESPHTDVQIIEPDVFIEDDPVPAPKPRRAPRRKAPAAAAAAEINAEADTAPVAEAPAVKPKRKPRTKKAEAEAAPEIADAAALDTRALSAVADAPVAQADASEAAPRRGWWQRTFGE
ncbi:MAG: ribonuclease E/G [Alphaproteobacteria bacterium]|nr:ribonuclease E/G [Alphaproteobacteria bacterium]MDE2340980.1 ribonuclease E/G [Alphaproteobacteria bacterium]